MRIAVLLVFFATAPQLPAQSTLAISDDIHHFWEAYDQIAATADTAEHAQILDRLFLDRGTPGLSAMMQRRNLTGADYLNAIRQHPRFWESVRANTLGTDALDDEVRAAVEGLRAVYPALRPAGVYFTMGAYRTNGMTLGDVVFIGSEIALADSSVITSDFEGAQADHMRTMADQNPIAHIGPLVAHEYVHTQQGPFGTEVLSIALQEGVASYLAELATGAFPRFDAFDFEPAHRDSVREVFSRIMFGSRALGWMWSSRNAPFGVRDLGYAIGYAIAKAYRNQAADSMQAVADLIELDYQDPAAVDALVEASGYFEQPLADLRARVPAVSNVEGLGTDGERIAPGPRVVTLVFSHPMDARFRNFELGPLGMDHILRIESVDGWSEDGRELTLRVDLPADQRLQLEISEGFRSAAGVPLSPYLIDVTTGPAGL